MRPGEQSQVDAVVAALPPGLNSTMKSRAGLAFRE
jgi:hypothetical protein